MEGGLSLAIYLSAAILLLSLVGCLPDLISSTIRWFVPERPFYPLGFASAAESGSAVAALCEVLMTISAACLVVALLIKRHAR